MGKVVHSKETLVKVNNIELCYDTFGDPKDPAMLLIMGLGSQMIRWADVLCEQLAALGFWVIRYDNRDVGKSTKFEDAGVPNVIALRFQREQGEPMDVPYKVLDMAQDAVGLLDELKVDAAHVVGVSMGGMIAQAVAIHYPERVRTLTSIMSATGNPNLPPPKPEALMLLQQAPPTTRDEYIEYAVNRQRILCGTRYPIDETYVRDLAARSFDRGIYPEGTARQLAAVLASGNRKPALQAVKIPTLVIHGDADPLVPVEGGKDTAGAIPGAKLVIIEGMGHDIPASLAPQIIKPIIEHTK